jgi:hypothetical protein
MSRTSRACRDFDSALRDGDRESARAHAADCPACRERLADWEAISAAAAGLRRDDEPPELWPRIREALILEAERQPAPSPWWRTPLVLRAAAVSLAVLLAVPTAWLVLRSLEPAGYVESRQALERRLLTEQALDDVETAEAAYVRSIEALASLVEPTIARPSSPLLVSYRERLLVLDNAITVLQDEVDRNRFNAHLRQELLSVYREKEITLRAILEESRS